MKKILNITIPIITFFIGIIGTYLVCKLNLTGETVVTSKTVNEVSITETNTIKDSVEKVYDSVVTVESYSYGMKKSLGTGIVYKTDEKYGYVLTNNHVISGSSSFKITTTNGDEVEATLLGSDEYVDAAVLRIDAKYVISTAEFGDSTKLEIGDTVFTVGTPVSKEYAGTVTKGIVSGKERTVTTTLDSGGSFMLDVIQTNAAINPGNSGGPLCNINGEIVGINTLKLVENEVEGMGFAIPIEMVTAVLDRLENNEKITRPLLGVSLADINNDYYLRRNNIYIDSSIKNGTVVFQVENNSTASEIGLKKGDVILKIDNIEIKNTTHFKYLLYKHQVGDKVKVEYFTNNETKTVEVTLNNGLNN